MEQTDAVCPFQNLTRFPRGKWYQRDNFIHLSLEITDCQKDEFSLQNDSFSFRGVDGGNLNEYEMKVQLYRPVNVEGSRCSVKGRQVDIWLEKEEKSLWWERLTQDQARQHWLRIDFQNWKDQFEKEDVEKESMDELSLSSLLEGMERQAGPGSGEASVLQSLARQNQEMARIFEEHLEKRELAKKLVELKRENQEKEKEMNQVRRELNARRQFYQENAPDEINQEMDRIYADADIDQE